jgi:GT2 family glycosyltransferase
MKSASLQDVVHGTQRPEGSRAVSVVIPSWNGRTLLERCLLSLQEQTRAPDEVIVVDNGSTDGTTEMLAERFATVRLIRLPENVGFGRAVNHGVRACSGRTLVLLNNDVICEERFLENLTAAVDPANDVVMVAGVLLQADRPDRIDTAGIEFDATLLAFDYLHGLPVSVLEGDVHDPPGPCAGAAAFDRDAFESVGGFDENFFAYLEDVDLVARLLARGARCRLAANARALHRHSATLGARSRRKADLIGWSRGYMIGKYRLHRRPGLLARTVIGEAIAAVGKIALDRAGMGLRPRLAGWRVGLRAPPEPLPELAETCEIGFLDAQRRRIRRRMPAR